MSERIPVLSDALFEVFGTASWVLLPAGPARGIASELEAEILDEQFSWCENPHLGEASGALVLTAPMNGWMLLLGASETIGGTAALLSEQRDVFRAMIDVRLPAMSWAHLQNGMPTRTVSVELGDDGALVTRTAGDPLPFEETELAVPTSSGGWESFFYPVAIVMEHGISLDALEEALDRPSVTLRIE
ncbi:hypothetical protein [Leifsonia sp. AG29]|uniref:hypothetical protein n=1 Tax=Leifsonia sp. AG29 TaxID=2598860 RepID=UPI00131BEA70|nr:hypothetical protein [Leifsonia sp. AG29]